MRIQNLQAMRDNQERENKNNQSKFGNTNEGQFKEVSFSIEDHKMMKGLRQKLKDMKK